LRLFRSLFLVTALILVAGSSFAMPIVSDVVVDDDQRMTRVILKLNQAVAFRAFTLADPDRVVLDLPAVRWLERGTFGAAGDGLIAKIRHGRHTSTSSRLVLDCRRPVTVREATLQQKRSGAYHLVLDITGGTLTGTGGLSLQAETEKTIETASTVNVGGVPMQPVIGSTGLAIGDVGSSALVPGSVVFQRPKPRPMGVRASIPTWVVVIDPGHGGQDPGALSLHGAREKEITLTAARELREELKKLGRYRVLLTRERDVFIRLRHRIAIARAAGADLFVSLHADKIDNPEVRGLSVYTLSEQASDAEAAALAEQENKADLLGGFKLIGETAEVADILIDLVQRDNMNQSAQVAALLVRELRAETLLLPRTHRFAGFAVLKSPDVPSALIELGYLSNPTDERLLRSSKHRRRLASAIARAIDAYFVRYEARNRH
jgi:N-acetylmuramoyl-L-alanine amidase